MNLSGGLTQRYRKAYDIAQRYTGNITRQKDYQSNVRAMYNAYENNDPVMARLNADIAENRRYTRRVYAEGQTVG